MLDLKLLEDKLDAALAKETEQSLTDWLSSIRQNNKFQNLGPGSFEQKKTIHDQCYVFWGSFYIPESTENICDVSNVSYLHAA